MNLLPMQQDVKRRIYLKTVGFLFVLYYSPRILLEVPNV